MGADTEGRAGGQLLQLGERPLLCAYLQAVFFCQIMFWLWKQKYEI